MTTQISPQMRIVALAGVILIALAGGSLVFLRQAKPGTVNVPSTPRLTTPAATTPATSAGHRPGLRTQTTSKSSTPSSSRTAHHPHATPPKVNPQLPAPLRAALDRRSIVVVGTFDPQVHEDALALAEARAGAAAAGVPFVPVNLLDDRVAGPLTALLAAGQLLPTPGVLVYRRPGKLVYRFDGYLDRAAVTQAVRDVKK